MKSNFNLQRKFFIFLAIIVLLVFLKIIGALAFVDNIFITALKPNLKISRSAVVEINNSYNQNTDKRDLQKLLAEKIAENKHLLIANAQLKYIEEENKILRQHLNFLKKVNFKYILARVMLEKPILNNIYEHSKIIIDKGLDDGLKNDLAILDQDGIIIGRITKIFPKYALVSLLTDQDCKFAIRIQGRGKEIMGIAQGEDGLTIKINFIPQNEVIQEGEIITTSGLEEEIPTGIPLGKIIKINKENNELWQNALIKPLSDLDNLSIVSVALPNNNQ